LLSVDVHHHCRPQWTRGRHAQVLASRSLSRLLFACSSQHRLPVCVTALPCLALLDRTCRARESTLTTAFRPALPHPVSHSLIGQLHERLPVLLARSTDRPTDQAATSAPPRQSHQLAQALISPTCRLLCLLAACDLLDLAASATVSAPSPCDAAANNNATAFDQPFACGRPIHLATSSPNKLADFRSSLA
jgi:hypothetical protein